MDELAAVISSVLADRGRRLQRALALPDAREGQKRVRTTARRVRSDLRVLGGLLDPPTVDAVTTRAATLASAIGPARDLQLVAARLARMSSDLDPTGIAEVSAALDAEIARLEEPASAVVAEGLADTLARDLLQLAAAPPLIAGAAWPALPRAAAATAERVRQQVGRLGPRAEPERLHRLRITVKRARYALEVMAVAQPECEWPVEPLRQLQDRLGEMQDCEVAGAWFEDVMLSATGTAVARRLAARARAQAVAQRVGLEDLTMAAVSAAATTVAQCASS